MLPLLISFFNRGDIMADLVQIKVNTVELEKSAKQLSLLSQNILNRRVQVQFTYAKGNVADSLLTAAKQLNEIGVALASIIQPPQTAITNTSVSFADAENTNTQRWDSLEE